MAAPYEAILDESHCWGCFREIQLGHDALLRVIEFEEGGRTSVHRHGVAETLLVAAGAIRYFIGDDPQTLTEYTLRVGDTIRIEVNVWHAAEYLSADEPGGNALAMEYVAGDIQGGNYPVTRAIAARPSARRRHAQQFTIRP